MRKFVLPILLICFLFAGCTGSTIAPEAETNIPEQTTAPLVSIPETKPELVIDTEPAVSVTVVHPLPDSTMENLSDSIVSISLEKGGTYLDETGKLNMEFTVYSYDRYDMVDISTLKVGDTLVTHAGELEINSLESTGNASISINGGLYEDGFDLVTDDDGIFYECGYNDSKNWYEVGKAILPISADFEYHDYSDLDQGEKVYYAGSFLTGEITDYHFTPDNTMIRIENGEIVEMNRVYIP
jgi:hypothetical protein